MEQSILLIFIVLIIILARSTFCPVAQAWGIGANDVANSFATSVGSRTLKLWQACIVSFRRANLLLTLSNPLLFLHNSQIASIFEFTGAIGLGGETTKTVAGDISNTVIFQDAPEIYM